MGPEWRHRKIPTFFLDSVRPPYKSTITAMPTYGNCHTPQWSPRPFLTSTEPGASYHPKRNADVSLCISTADVYLYIRKWPITRRHRSPMDTTLDCSSTDPRFEPASSQDFLSQILASPSIIVIFFYVFHISVLGYNTL